ncbi:hypothetical protein [Pseudoalteromonas sp. ASV78]|uniref:hypothetical protein n=1 Tax=Pseudoalteromonas sp. ASV78 TaxID=3397851 RepID=UPI0039FBB8C7
MEYFDFLLLFLNSNWKAIIATAGLFLSGYFAYQKVGNKITVNYHVGIEGYSDTQIVKLVLSNRKDKTVSIWGIDAVINQDIEFKLIDPEEPIILKSGESICLPIKKYSYLNVNGDRYKPEFFGNFEFYANLGNKS